MKQDENGKWPMPTLATIPRNTAYAAIVAWNWLAQSRTGFTEQSKLTQAADVEIYLCAVLVHQGARLNGVLVREVVMKLTPNHDFDKVTKKQTDEDHQD